MTIKENADAIMQVAFPGSDYWDYRDSPQSKIWAIVKQAHIDGAEAMKREVMSVACELSGDIELGVVHAINCRIVVEREG